MLRWAALTTSMLAMVGGFLLSLAFLKWYAVPHLLYRLASMPRVTQCYLLHPLWGVNVNGEGAQPMDSGQCVFIPLVYKETTGGNMSGFLIPEPDGEIACKKIQHCYCEDCMDQIHPKKNSSVLYVSGQTVPVQQWVTCFHQTAGEKLNSRSTLYMFNAMMWPSLMFVFGFVGTFFSCLNLQKAEYNAGRSCGGKARCC